MDVLASDIIQAQNDASKARLLLYSSSIFLGTYLYGVAIAASSPALSWYQDEQDTPLEEPLTDEQGSVFGEKKLLRVEMML